MSQPGHADGELIDLVAVPGGTVELADRRTRTRWRVDVAPFLLGQVPVTQAQYREILGESPSMSEGEDLPVETVSWLDAVRFCNALSVRERLACVYVVDGDAWRRLGRPQVELPCRRPPPQSPDLRHRRRRFPRGPVAAAHDLRRSGTTPIRTAGPPSTSLVAWPAWS